MNLGQAVAVCLYELARRESAGVGLHPATGHSPATTLDEKGSSATGSPARAGDLERLTQVFFDVLRTSGYVEPRGTAATEEKLRRMVRRMDLKAADAELWLGMLRQIEWKLRQEKASHPDG